MIKPNSLGGVKASKWEEIELPPLPETGPCRYCKHNEWQHPRNEKDTRPCNENQNYNAKCRNIDRVVILIPSKIDIGSCPCMDYVPGDNLAFLEWQDKRGY